MDNPIFFKIVNFLFYICFLLSGLSLGFILFRITRYSENYLGWNVLHLVPLFLAVLAMAFVRIYFNQSVKSFNYTVILLSFLAILFVFAIYHFNILVPYEVWLKRGMPARPF